MTDTRKDDERDDEMIFGLTADERRTLLAGLDALPDTMPPRAVWNRIREQGEAEGLLRDPRAKSRNGWLDGAGLAAAAALVAVIVAKAPDETTFPTVPPADVADNAVAGSTLRALMVESRQLEDDLRALPEGPRVVRAGTRATILELEDRIAAIDYQLSDPTLRMSDADREVFWRERVRLMKLLVRLRYAQTQRAVY